MLSLITAIRTAPPRLARLDRDSAPHLLNCAIEHTRVAVHTRAARLLAWWWGVELGAGSSFYGLPVFRRLPGASLRIGRNCQFRSAVWSNVAGLNRPCLFSALTSRACLEVGEGCGFSGTVIECADSVVLGRSVMCGANVTIADTDSHAIHWLERAKDGPAKTAPVRIGDNVWLGMNVLVLKGVEIGAGTVVGAGSVVTRSLPARVIAAGQPARVIRHIDGSSL